jgi:hypothetical protein
MVVATHELLAFVQILRWNWCRVTIALCFTRAVTPLSVALRHCILPLIDSIMNLVMPTGVDYISDSAKLCAHEAALIHRRSIDVQLFTHCKYFETETSHLSASLKVKAKVRKAPDS